jgi:hypothetical protein
MKIQSVEIECECQGDEGVMVTVSQTMDAYSVEMTLRDGTRFRVKSKNVRVRMPDAERILRR